MSFRKNRPMCSPTPFCQKWRLTLTAEKVALNCCRLLSFSKKMSEVNHHPTGENSPNLGHPGFVPKKNFFQSFSSMQRTRCSLALLLKTANFSSSTFKSEIVLKNESNCREYLVCGIVASRDYTYLSSCQFRKKTFIACRSPNYCLSRKIFKGPRPWLFIAWLAESLSRYEMYSLRNFLRTTS
jgi:hypothetical protein